MTEATGDPSYTAVSLRREGGAAIIELDRPGF
jgi:hypothetical protein